jgi:hypothetical protein
MVLHGFYRQIESLIRLTDQNHDSSMQDGFIRMQVELVLALSKLNSERAKRTWLL